MGNPAPSTCGPTGPRCGRPSGTRFARTPDVTRPDAAGASAAPRRHSRAIPAVTAPATPDAQALKATVPCSSCRTLNRVDLARLGAGPRCARCREPLALDRPLPVDDASFARVVDDAQVPVPVDFYDDWCGRCRAMAPHLDALARRHVGRALVAKLDTDRNQSTAGRFGIRSIPTLVAFRGGREAGREVGLVPPARLEALIA